MLTELSLAQLNVAYNRAVSELALPLKEVKGFKDKPTGVARLTKVMADHNLVLDGGKLVKGNGAATAEPAPVTDNVVAFKAKAVKPAKPAPKADKVDKVHPLVQAAIDAKAAVKRGPTAQFADHQVITMNVADNPKKKGSMAYKRLALYRDGMTIKEALDAGLRRDDFRWDSHPDRLHIFIK